MKKVIHLQQEDTLAYRPICNKYTNHLHCLLFISSCSLYPSNFEGAVGHKASQSTLPVVGFCPRYMYVILYKVYTVTSIREETSSYLFYFLSVKLIFGAFYQKEKRCYLSALLESPHLCATAIWVSRSAAMGSKDTDEV